MSSNITKEYKKIPDRAPDRIFYGKIKFWLDGGNGVYLLPMKNGKELTFAVKQSDMYINQEAQGALFIGLLAQLS